MQADAGMWKKKKYTYCSETKEMKNYIEKKIHQKPCNKPQ